MHSVISTNGLSFVDRILETVFDTEQDRYQLVAIGWQDRWRVHGRVIHIDIKGDKVWLQHDSTDNELVERGIPKTQIVLGFQPEHRRQYSGFSVN